MKIERILAIASRIVRQFLRDRRTVAFLILVPSFVMGLLGYLVNQERATYEVALVNADAGVALPSGSVVRLGDVVAGALGGEPGLRVVDMTPGQAQDALAAGSIAAVFTLPGGLTRDVVTGAGASIGLRLEGAQAAVIQAVSMSAAAALRRCPQLLQDALAALPGAPSRAVPVKPPLQLDVSYLHGGADLGPLDYMASAFIAGFVFFFVFLLTCVSFLRERSSGTIERLAASPVSRGEVVLGYLGGFTVFAIIEALIILLFAIYVLGAVFVGSVWLVLLVELLLTLGAVSLGILLSFFARNELQVIQFVPLVIIPQFLLGGLVWPVETLARPLQWIAAVMPLTYAAGAMHDVMIKGAGIGDIAGNLVFLLGFAIVVATLAAAVLRREVA